MKTALGLAMFLLLADGFNGKWLTDGGPERAVFEFQVEGNKLTGSVTRLDQPNIQVIKYDGTVDKETITFTVPTPDGSRTVKFSGKLNGDSIVFNRQAALTSPDARPGGNGILGMNGPVTVTVRRAKD
jgi:hypothetical protein